MIRHPPSQQQNEDKSSGKWRPFPGDVDLESSPERKVLRDAPFTRLPRRQPAD
jgi:hypothetical protein